MTLGQIAALVVLAAALGQLKVGRSRVLLAASTAILFWLQPTEPIHPLGFWLPFGTLALAVLTWALTAEAETRTWRRAWPDAAVIVAMIGLVELTRFLHLPLNAAVAAVAPWSVLIAIAFIGAMAGLVRRPQSTPRIQLALLGILIMLIFIVLKSPAVASVVITRIKASWPSATVAGGYPLAWLGFSYVAFRLLHTVRDRQSGRLGSVDLGEYVTYVIFFPALTSGPIDRVERFVGDLRSPLELKNDDWLEAGTRLVLGLFKKFVVADLLAVISISDLLVEHVQSAGWMWLFVYAYAFRIYLDFSGYTDMAIGMGRLIGIRLPENFEAPYLKRNIALFWNSWHMSLTQWFRAYVFNPLTRGLRLGAPSMPTWLGVLMTQVITMVLIGLWHGITLGFAVWGLWHALGLFVHNRWVEFIRGRPSPGWEKFAASRAGGLLGTLATFNFVALGWLWFALSSPALGWKALLTLIGAG